MNVTNRRKSTDADTPTTQPTQPQHQLAYVSCRQAATATTATTTNRSRQDQLLLQQHQQQQHKEDEVEEQEQVVTSTSSDCVLPLSAEGEGEEVTLASLVTSPARITSSTNNYEHLTYNSDSLSLEEMPVMPTTSENARLETEQTSTAALKLIQNSINNNGSSSSSTARSTNVNDIMVARDTTLTTIAEAGSDKTGGPGGGGSGGIAVASAGNDQQASTSTNSESTMENHKLILKLPKPIAAESQQNSHAEDDLRKVEPLKINLHNTSLSHISSHHTPKITIKPIVKDPLPDIMISSEECSSSAEDDIVSKIHNSEPHIVPKLTIRAKNEEHGTSHSTVVPKLTIKINDSSNNSTSNTATNEAPAANTPPLPKLTIKTGQDGHSESIITNISPASSTTSSSSSSLASTTSSSSSSSSMNSTKDTSSGLSNIVPKLTIKPLQKSLDSSMSLESKDAEKHPSIPKLCIKGNMICAGESSTPTATASGTSDEGAASSSKIPKLTIKTGQEHAVIITQHNESVNASGGMGIPKLTIKTKSLEINEDSSTTTSNASNTTENTPNEKIPKITIKTTTTNTNDTPKRGNKTQLETSSTVSASIKSANITPLSPKQQAVPKLTISRQQTDMVVTNIHSLQDDELGTIPKMTIKTQSKLVVESSVPKLTIKSINTTKKRPSSTEESGISDDAEEDDVMGENDEDLLNQQTKTVPKLTIKNLGSPQQKLKVVQAPESENVVAKTTFSNTASNASSSIPSANAVIILAEDPNDFNDLLTVDNGGEESSNSQEFCGFNENTGDSSVKLIKEVVSNVNTDVAEQEVDEIRRHSDDMDIDEDLQTEHEPQIFQNVKHFNSQETTTAKETLELVNGNSTKLKLHPPKMTHIIDTVDLTSSPSRSSSPAQFDYAEDSNPSLNQTITTTTNLPNMPSTNILLERLQRETTVIQNTQQLKHQQQLESHSSSIQLPPPLQPKPNPQQTSPVSLKYPQLAERLMANGSSPTNIGNTNSLNLTNNANTDASTDLTPPEAVIMQTPQENIIDSIEILDTPEGSPRNSLDECPEILKVINEKSSASSSSLSLPNGLHYPKDSEDQTITHNNNNNNSNLKRHAPPVATSNLAGQTISQTRDSSSSTADLPIPPSKQRRLNADLPKSTPTIVNNNNDTIKQKVLNNSYDQLEKPAATEIKSTSAITIITAASTIPTTTPHQRARKQKHEHLLPVAMEEVNPTNSNDSLDLQQQDSNSNDNTNENATPIYKKRGRPKKIMTTTSDVSTPIQSTTTPVPNKEDNTPQMDSNSKSRRVLLLRKRLAIDMVDAEQPLAIIDETEANAASAAEALRVEEEANKQKHELELSQQRKERSLRTPLRTSRRSNTPSLLQMENKTSKSKAPSTSTSSLAMDNTIKKASISVKEKSNEFIIDKILASNASLSSVFLNISSTLASTVSSATITQSDSLSMATQIDLTMSSSSSNSNSSTTNTITTVEANQTKQTAISGSGGGGSSNNSMLPPTTILSSDPLPDVIFKPNDFSSIIATQQLRAPMRGISQDLNDSQDEDMTGGDFSGADNSGDDSASSSSMSNTPGRGRGRGKSTPRGGRSKSNKAQRSGSGAIAASQNLALSLPRAVVILNKHIPDLGIKKGLYRPAPAVFEEDTRMSADMTQNQSQSEPPQTPTKQPDFLNNEESQSSIISNTSILDPNVVAALQSGSSSAVKKPQKRKKMEVCVAEDAEITVESIAEYDWPPPPKGYCTAKNRDTFMIQEQVALYLGIKSFKRKYPDLPRRQIDMEERNFLQEKSLVSEKMCDMGITAVWASDILDIMYTDFYSKYEEYKDCVRQKHLRQIEAKQKSLGLNVAGRGLQARERAMLSTSKWNAYFNRTRKDERLSCLDMQTLTVNRPCPASAPIAAIPYRPIANAVALAAKAEKIPQPPTLLKKRVWEPIRPRDVYYPLSLVPGQFCQKYHDYTAQELRQFPLNTVLDHPPNIWPQKPDSTDTDSATETLEMADSGKSSNVCAAERLNQQRRVRRTRAKNVRKLNNEEFKVPPVPGAISASSTDTCTSTDDSSSDTDSDSSCSSSSDDTNDDENSPATCGVCQQPQNRNLKDIPELFVQCYTCRRKVHPSCIEMPHRMATRIRNYNWQCADCKCCIKCKRKQDQNKMLFCEQCDRGFHIYCLGIKAVPDGRWSCERCSVCMRCGATKPEGLPLISVTGEKIKQVRNRKVKWINEYRIDHVTKLREHCSMLCVPCGRIKTTKRVQINTHHNTTNTYITSPGSSSALSPSNVVVSSSSSSSCTSSQTQQTITTTTSTATTTLSQMSPSSITSINAAITQISNHATTTLITPSTTTLTTTAISLESNDSTSISNEILITTTPQFTTANTVVTATTTLSSTSTLTSSSSSATTSSTTTTVGGPPPVVA